MGIQSLEVRRIRGDLIELFKIEKGLERVSWCVEPTRVDGRYERKEQLRREIVHGCDQRHHFFINRTVHSWNELPEDTVLASSTSEFKAKLDKFASNRRPIYI